MAVYAYNNRDAIDHYVAVFEEMIGLQKKSQ